MVSFPWKFSWSFNIYPIWNFFFILDVWELRQVLEAMGQKPTEEELFQMISEVDENMSGSIDFAEFLKVIENQKERAENFDDESDMIGGQSHYFILLNYPMSLSASHFVWSCL